MTHVISFEEEIALNSANLRFETYSDWERCTETVRWFRNQAENKSIPAGFSKQLGTVIRFAMSEQNEDLNQLGTELAIFCVEQDLINFDHQYKDLFLKRHSSFNRSGSDNMRNKQNLLAAVLYEHNLLTNAEFHEWKNKPGPVHHFVDQWPKRNNSKFAQRSKVSCF